MFKIQLADGEIFKNDSGRVQHYKTIEKADAKISRLGVSGAIAVECIAKTKSVKVVEAVVKTEKKKAKKTKKSA